MRNRSYIGDGVYASWDGSNIVLELECGGRPIFLNKENWHALMEFFGKHGQSMDPHSQLVEIPHSIFPEVVAELRELEKVAVGKGTKLQ